MLNNTSHQRSKSISVGVGMVDGSDSCNVEGRQGRTIVSCNGHVLLALVKKK